MRIRASGGCESWVHPVSSVHHAVIEFTTEATSDSLDDAFFNKRSASRLATRLEAESRFRLLGRPSVSASPRIHRVGARSAHHSLVTTRLMIGCLWAVPLSHAEQSVFVPLVSSDLLGGNWLVVAEIWL